MKILAKAIPVVQMIGELKALPHPDGSQGTLMDAIDLVVPHQANKNMVLDLAKAAGVAADRLYFNIELRGGCFIRQHPHDQLTIARCQEGRIDQPPARVLLPVQRVARSGRLRGDASGSGNRALQFSGKEYIYGK